MALRAKLRCALTMPFRAWREIRSPVRSQGSHEGSSVSNPRHIMNTSTSALPRYSSATPPDVCRTVDVSLTVGVIGSRSLRQNLQSRPVPEHFKILVPRYERCSPRPNSFWAISASPSRALRRFASTFARKTPARSQNPVSISS